MHFAVVTLFPDMLSAVTDYGVTGRAVTQGQLQVECWNPRDFSQDRHRTVDDRPYGGGPGMVMMMPPMMAAITAARESCAKPCRVIHLTPQGRKLDQAGVRELAECDSLVLIAGRYEGIDERIIEAAVDEEWSVGDYVLSGGELAAMVLIDAVSRLQEGVLGHEGSAREDSFYDGLLDYPHYTRPEVVDGRAVPGVLLSGDHDSIRRWRLKQALGRTWQRRPDLLEQIELDNEQQQLLDEFKSDFRTD
ncbi:MAG TPA: tRNA (guanosine(37)-N1)-methyltransferase TrmD [Gammaproteobacteria bacterium]|nr:tRNA (guanosine(37)-N1)-methyltransferase TrmD [Gammaproteobacteria bacterium]